MFYVPSRLDGGCSLAPVRDGPGELEPLRLGGHELDLAVTVIRSFVTVVSHLEAVTYLPEAAGSADVFFYI